MAATFLPLYLGLDMAAVKVAEKVLPEGSTIMGYSEKTVKPSGEKKTNEQFCDDVNEVNVAKEASDSLTVMGGKKERQAPARDYKRGMHIFAECKAWMDRLTKEERDAYRAEMAAFMAEQGLAEDRYSLSAMKNVNPTNIIGMATLFAGLGTQDAAGKKGSISIEDSVAGMAANLQGVEIGEGDMEMLNHFATILSEKDAKAVIKEARKELESSEGNNKVAATVLAALVQTTSGVPSDQVMTSDKSLFDPGALKSMASRHWKRIGKKPPEIKAIASKPVEPVNEAMEGAVLLEVEEGESAAQNPFMQLSTHLGLVTIPNDPLEVRDWIAVAHTLNIAGYVSLGDEIVILRNDGEMLRNSDVWSLDSQGYTYHFRIEKIEEGKVELTAEGRELIEL